jgi:hypothetical protein
MSGRDAVRDALRLLERQQEGSPEAARELKAFIKQLEKSLAAAPPHQPLLFDLRMILAEWEGMFSYSPGRIEGLPVILRLAKGLLADGSGKRWDLYSHPDWGKLVDLRGPVDEVCETECTKCGTRYYLMILSGFLDMKGYVSYPSGNALLRSIYDDSPLPKPKSGSPYKNGCPKCGVKSHEPVKSISPYQDFATRTYIRTDLS